jgi:hypothetical protein
MKTPKAVTWFVHRCAETGRFVSGLFARLNPKTTVRERRKKP